jgi:hypothetical protein
MEPEERLADGLVRGSVDLVARLAFGADPGAIRGRVPEPVDRRDEGLARLARTNASTPPWA